MPAATAYDKAAADIRRPGIERADGRLDTMELVRLATLAPSSHNTQPWKFRARPQSITILPDFSRRCPVVDPDDSHLFKSLGCAAENLIHAAAAQGFAADTRFEPTEESIVVRFERSLEAQATDLSRAILTRQCTKRAYDRTPVESAGLQRLERAGLGAGVRTMLLCAPAQRDAVIDYVTRGNLNQLSDRAFRDELVSWIRFNPRAALAAGDGLAGRTGGQPPLPAWLASLIIGTVLAPKKQVDVDARNIRSSAGIAVFLSRRDDKAAWVETGRAYERFALQAAALDIRTAFINQPIEVLTLRPQLESWLKVGEEHALLMVRFGHGPLAPYSLRRPVDAVLSDESVIDRSMNAHVVAA